MQCFLAKIAIAPPGLKCVPEGSMEANTIAAGVSRFSTCPKPVHVLRKRCLKGSPCPAGAPGAGASSFRAVPIHPEGDRETLPELADAWPPVSNIEKRSNQYLSKKILIFADKKY
eukprot:g76977.t1